MKLLDDRIANPAYGLLLVTGVALLVVGDIPLTTRWIQAALALYALLVLLGLFGYTPTLRRQIQLAETVGPDAPEYRAIARRGVVLGSALAVLAVALVFLMVVKPAP